MKKILFMLCTICTCLFAQSVKFGVPENVGILNPHTYSPEMFAQDMVFEGLVGYSQENKVTPSLASSWKISDDGKTYTFYLRKGVKFSNGEIFDAKAVKANFDAIFAQKELHSWSAFANAFDKLEVLDDYTVKIYLKHVYEPTLRELALVRPYRFVAPSVLKNGQSTTKDGKSLISAPIGTGKWAFDSTKLGEWDKFVRNENYWGKKPILDGVECKVIPDANSRALALRTNEIDLIYGNPSYLNSVVSIETYTDFKKNNNYQIFFTKPINTTLIAINSSTFPTNELAVRKALNMAIDKDAISKYVYHNMQPKADFFYPSDVPNSKIDRKPYTYNLKAAKKLLEDAGWKMGKNGIYEKNGKQLALNLYYIGTDGEQKAIAEVIQSQYKQAGIALNIIADETSSFYKRQKTAQFDLVFHATWGAPYEPEIFMASFKVPAHADYVAQSGIKTKKELDAKIDAISSSVDDKQKAKLVKEVLTTLHDEAVYIPVVFNTNKGIATKKLGGVKGSIIGYEVPFESLYFK